MGLVETVAGELLHQVEDHRRLSFRNTARHSTGHELATLLGHFFRLLFAHRAAQQVSATERVAGQHLRNLHDLLLVQDHAVGGLQDGLEVGMQVVDRRAGAVMFASDEVIHHAGLQRPGTEQRHQRDDVFEAIGLQAADQVFHAARFELEHGRGARRLEQRKSFRVVHRQRRQIQRRLAARRTHCIDGLQSPIDDGQCAQTKEVELDQTGGLDIVLVKLCDDVGTALFAVQRREISEHRGCNDHTTRMLAGVAR